jgi:hypothetical protein
MKKLLVVLILVSVAGSLAQVKTVKNPTPSSGSPIPIDSVDPAKAYDNARGLLQNIYEPLIDYKEPRPRARADPRHRGAQREERPDHHGGKTYRFPPQGREVPQRQRLTPRSYTVQEPGRIATAARAAHYEPLFGIGTCRPTSSATAATSPSPGAAEPGDPGDSVVFNRRPYAPFLSGRHWRGHRPISPSRTGTEDNAGGHRPSRSPEQRGP